MGVFFSNAWNTRLMCCFNLYTLYCALFFFSDLSFFVFFNCLLYVLGLLCVFCLCCCFVLLVFLSTSLLFFWDQLLLIYPDFF